jgi:hypothetical protein
MSSSGLVPAGLFASSMRAELEDVSLVHDAIYSNGSGRLHVTVQNLTDRDLPFRCSVVGRHFAPGDPAPRGHHVACGLSVLTTDRVGDVAARSYVCFRPSRIYVPARCVYQFDVVDVSVRTEGGCWGRSAPRWTLAQPNLFGDRVFALAGEDPAVYPEQVVSLTVRRRTTGPAVFCAALLGYLC